MNIRERTRNLREWMDGYNRRVLDKLKQLHAKLTGWADEIWYTCHIYYDSDAGDDANGGGHRSCAVKTMGRVRDLEALIKYDQLLLHARGELKGDEYPLGEHCTVYLDQGSVLRIGAPECAPHSSWADIVQGKD